LSLLVADTELRLSWLQSTVLQRVLDRRHGQCASQHAARGLEGCALQLQHHHGGTVMKHFISFLTLSTVFLLALLAIALSTAFAYAAGEDDAQTRPYMDPLVMGTSASSRCSSMFEILDANQDGYVTKDEARKSAETTANWKSFDSDHNDRLSYEEFCATR
jgi:hypothetical protein